MAILQFRKNLLAPTQVPEITGTCIRTYGQSGDIRRWLDVRNRAVARLRPGVRQFEPADFEGEFLAKPWWNPRHLWFAENLGPGTPQVLGTICLAMRGRGELAIPAVHWLAVRPEARRQGLGSLLLATLEAEAWRQGHREVCLETHSGWSAAVALYRRHGYQEA